MCAFTGLTRCTRANNNPITSQSASVLNLDVSSFLSLRCFNSPSVNYFNEMIVYIVAPAVAGLFVLLVYGNKVRKVKSEIRCAATQARYLDPHACASSDALPCALFSAHWD